ncbi:hypothetical protein T231_17750 [Tannerella sp. oral taxon BU063 isolate Cell 6/7/9]|uniref:Uncharacterized protein n=1 Tax=Tannerella sp. oral taxon BU063 isolate Cell 6/7/9 TaxID=1411021 RepID=W2CLP2_9BACT|nr:hypothetical protein T231_17750 [Tannerella sp. oral taxon BU063 isolate Cell 6/7/9]
MIYCFYLAAKIGRGGGLNAYKGRPVHESFYIRRRLGRKDALRSALFDLIFLQNRVLDALQRSAILSESDSEPLQRFAILQNRILSLCNDLQSSRIRF